MRKPLILFLSNCYGEDRSAALIAKEIKKIKPNVQVAGAPLLSEGEEYLKRGIPVITSSRVSPSGGFPLESLSGLMRDILSGYAVPTKYITDLKKVSDKINHIVIVGDVFLLVLGYLAFRKRPIFFAPTKSNYIKPHSKLEEFLMRRIPIQILTHDEHTASTLRNKNIHAIFLGNPAVDDISPTGIDFGIKGKRVIGILPGSRYEAYNNFLKILTVVDGVKRRSVSNSKRDEEIIFLCALASNIKENKIIDLSKKLGWFYFESNKFKGICKGNGKILFSYLFADVIANSECVIGLAGTANEQAAAMGKPIVSFVGTGSQTTKRRIKKQEKLLGGCLKFITDYPDSVISEVLLLLKDKKLKEERGRIGISRIGKSGGKKKIAQFLIKEFQL
jgi:uncharacterized protein (TIGR03492 family)